MKGTVAVKEKVKFDLKKIDFIILITMTILIGIGLYCVQQAFLFSEEQASVLLKQTLGVFLGYVLIAIIIFIDYHFISAMSFLLYLGMLLTLALTLFIAEDINNVKRWIVVFGIPFQPSELTKIVLIVFLAFLCNQFKNKLDKLYVFFILAFITALPV